MINPPGIRWLVGLLCALMFLTGCNSSALLQEQEDDDLRAAVQFYLRNYNDPRILGSRPPGDLPAVVEQYLQQYQPGPLPRLFQTTYLYDRNGVLLAERWGEGRRTWVSIDAISPHLIDAVIATEDSTFFTNSGLDPMRLAGAVVQNVQEGEILSGASTITMQLARNLFLPPERRFEPTIERKAYEVALAQELTRLFSKWELLEMYLNVINYGYLNYGIEAAARSYFAKSAAELTLAEATILAGIPKQPADLDLFTHFAAARSRQQIVLNLMVRHGYLNRADADRVYNTPLTLNPNPVLRPIQAHHFVLYLEQTIDARLGPGYAVRSGWQITSTLDLGLQELGQQIVAENVARFQPRYNLSNAALVALQPSSGEILALVGSADFFDESIDGQVNVATSRRQPGSAIKPVLYATALNDNLISPATVLWDTPVTYGLDYRPRNYDNRFHGPVTVRSALANSYNVPAVKLIFALSVPRMLEGAQAMGIRSLDRGDNWYGLSVAVGGGEVTLLELTGAFHVLANQGVRVGPTPIRAVANSRGQPVAWEPDQPPQAVVSSAAAFQVTDILSDEIARRPAFGANSPLVLSRPAAAKTGTTSNFRDNWTVGYTRYLVTGVWAGNSRGQPMRNTSGLTGAAPIWNAFMEAVLADTALMQRLDMPADEELWQFVPPPDVEQHPGCPPGMACREDGEFYAASWLAAMGDAGPLGDTMAAELTVPVYAQLGGSAAIPVYCSPAPVDAAAGQLRTLLKLTTYLGAPGVARESEVPPPAQPVVEDSARQELISRSDFTPVDYNLTLFDPEDQERLRSLAWSIRTRTPVFLGPCSGLSLYTVQLGNSWTGIASGVPLTAQELQAINPHIVRDEGILRVGDRMLVPNSQRIAYRHTGQLYGVQEGDSWNAIASKYALPMEILRIANRGLVRPNNLLRVGEEMAIPVLLEPLDSTPN